VITHKAGLASTLAHNHCIYPASYTVEASSDGASPDQTHFLLKFPATALANDEDATSARWYPYLKAAGVLDVPFKKVCEADRKTIHEHMLAENQLDAEHFPNISAELKTVREQASTVGSKTFAYEGTVALTVHGKTVVHPFAANMDVTGDIVHVEAVGTFSFTDFGIKPYSAVLGAVRNQDTFHVYVNAQARRGDAAGTSKAPIP
jgi:hypothetical protein